ncbi:MAG: prenyltransferase [Candidatus Pacebacteria bacterium]|nr:prenyltransferase [Candidatus Paceibacterota bacterium]MBP9780482.1 prenyltransferase [Candidatus Paceibacterota bacterium]
MEPLRILKISRPRFWLYELGTFFIGALTVIPTYAELTRYDILLYALFFLLPANLLIYGVNDIFDYETDKNNPKKGEYEALVHPKEHSSLYAWILMLTLPFAVITLWLPLPHILAFYAFIFFAVFYSAKPIRAKARPFFDSFFSAGHYIATGVFGYYLAGGEQFPWLGVIAGMCWAVAMHAFSAIPDIKMDKEAGLQTIATRLGKYPSMLLCSFLYIISALLMYFVIGWYALFAGVVYVVLVYHAYTAKSYYRLFKIYTYFPWVNAIVPAVWCMGYIKGIFS